MEKIFDLFDKIPAFDLIYIIITILTIIRCTNRGFVLSILSAARWLLAYVLTLFLGYNSCTFSFASLYCFSLGNSFIR